MPSVGTDVSTERLAVAFDASSAQSAILDRHGVVVETNKAWRLFAQLNGAPDGASYLGVNYVEFCEQECGADPIAEHVAAGLRSILAGERTVLQLEYSCHSPIEDRWYLLQATAAPVDGGAGVVVQHFDVTARRSFEDGVVMDRSSGERDLGSLLRARDVAPFQLLLIDFTGLPEVTDRLGKPAAAEALVHLIGRSRRVLRSGDVAFRASPHSLALALHGLDREAVFAITQRLHEALRQPVQLGATELTVAHSIGSSSGETGTDPASLLNAARSTSADLSTATLMIEPAIDSPVGPVGAPGRPEHTAATRPDASAFGTSHAIDVLLVEVEGGEVSLIASQLGNELTGEIHSTPVRTLNDALFQLSQHRFACVLLGVGLPDASDLDGLTAIHSAHPRLPVIVLSGPQDAGPAERAMRAGAQDVLFTSDLEPSTLNRAVALAAQRRRADLSEHRLAVLTQCPSDVVLVMGADGLMHYASPSLNQVLGMSSETAVGAPFHSLLCEEDRAATASAVHAAAGGSSELVARLAHSDGSLRWAEITIEDWSSDPAIGGLVLRLRDITERVGAVEELRLERATRDAIVTQSRDVAVLFHPDGEIVWTSPSCRTVFGVEPEDLLGIDCIDLIHPDDQGRVAAQFMTIPELGDHVLVEFRLVDPQGIVRWFEVLATNLVDDPSVGVVVGNMRDITARKSAEQRAKFKKTLLRAVGQPVVAADLERRVTFWNCAAETAFGWTEEEALGRPLSELLRPSDGWDDQADDFRALEADEVRSLQQAGDSWTGEFSVRNRSGGQTAVEVTSTPVFEHGELVGTVAVSTDLTERRRATEALERVASIVETTADAIYTLNADATVTSWNGGATALFGYEESRIVGQHVSILFPGDLTHRPKQVLELVGRGETVRDYDTRRVTADGREIRVSVTSSPLHAADGSVAGCSVIARDITERSQLLQRIEDERRSLLDAQHSAHLGSFEIDLITGQVHRSEEMLRILGVGPDDMTKGNDLTFVHPEDASQVRQALDAALAGHQDIKVTHRVVRPDGEIRWVVSSTSAYVDPSGRAMSGTVHDITELHLARLELEELAYRDPLTGLPNRTFLSLQLDEVLEKAASAGTHTAVGLADLDRFKVINDRLGHGAGDAVLRAVATRFAEQLIDGDILGRFGGDEFVVLRPGSNASDALELGKSLNDALAAPLVVGERRFDVSTSVGMVLVEPGGTAEDALKEADAAMYVAKSTGRSTAVLLDDQLRASLDRRIQIEIELRSAIERNQMSVVFQPIVDLATARPRGFEALLRWEHPVLGRVGPDEFITIAEETGTIVAIGEWVLRQSLKHIARWRQLPGASALWVAVNLSGRQVAQDDIVDLVAAALTDARQTPDALHLEVTEGVLVDTVHHAIGKLTALRDLGVSIKIDDFGTGYSSLSYLKMLPIDSLKIDRSFVDGLGSNRHDTTIVRAILSMASTLDLEVVAEGVETVDQLTALEKLGCPLGQGFLWSPGVDPSAATRWLSERLGRPQT